MALYSGQMFLAYIVFFIYKGRGVLLKIVEKKKIREFLAVAKIKAFGILNLRVSI